MNDCTKWEAPPDNLDFGANQVHLWGARLDVTLEVETHLATYLTEAEQARAGRFRFERDRSRFVVARGILRDLLGSYLRQTAAAVVIAEDEKHKPCLTLAQDSSPSSPLRFNISHSEQFAGYAFSRGLEVGVDIEYIGRDIEFETLAESYFSESEKSQLRALPESERKRSFFVGWTRKEAFLKATGEGLRVRLDSFDVSGKANDIPVLRSGNQDDFSLYSFDPAPDYTGALAVEGQEHDLRFCCWKPRML